jgi:hypothetical protein
MNSFKVLKENKELIIFPILSGISLVLVMGSFVVAAFAASNWDIESINTENEATNYFIVFLFYLVNYFIIVFFNTALIHCTRSYFNGEKVSVSDGLKFAFSRIGAIFSWAVVAATVGMILRAIQENVGWLGKIITGFIGLVWTVSTFFVVPVIAYEKLGPIAAVKRSAEIMKEKWGESLAGNFSFGLVQFIAVILIAVPVFFLGFFINPIVGIVVGLLALFIVLAIMSAAQTIFVSAVYHNIQGDPVKHFEDKFVENLFEKK